LLELVRIGRDEGQIDGDALIDEDSAVNEIGLFQSDSRFMSLDRVTALGL
jgi:hypothetical protein